MESSYGEYLMRQVNTVVVIVLLVLAGCAGGTGPSTNNTTTAGSTQVDESTKTPNGTIQSSQQTEWTVTVVEVVDGDTLKVEFDDGRTENIRLLGVDTPEVHTDTDPAEFDGVPKTADGSSWLRDWGHKSSDYAQTMLAGEEITIRTDPGADRRGSYGRLLVYVYYDDGTLFNKQLLSQGYARMYESSFSRKAEFASLEETAQQNAVGVWGYGSARSVETASVADGRSLRVAEINADADGNDHTNLNDEYIVFENTGDTTIDLGGWSVSDTAGRTYTFSGISLELGETVILHTGSGTGTESGVYWGSERAVWNNDGDTITVRTDSGGVVVEHTYDRR